MHDKDLFLNNVISLLTDFTVQFNLHKELRCLEGMIFLSKETFAKSLWKLEWEQDTFCFDFKKYYDKQNS